MRIAIIHDYLCGLGGSERIFQYMCEEFSEADAYTLAYNPSTTLPYFKTRQIRTTWLNTFVRSGDSFRWSFPIATYVMQHLDLSQYDLVLSSSATTAKYVTVPNGRHICYCYIPTRAIWQFDEYFGASMKSAMLKLFIPYLKKRDFAAAQRVNDFIAISQDSRGHIKKYYNRDASVIYCPIELDKFRPSHVKKGHYLIVSRLEHWKRVDYAVEAFNRLGLPLRIIGTGAEGPRLRSLAKENITFLGSVDDATLEKEYQEAAAVIFTPYLEYGLIPLEANACGTPVICYGKGGITETMIAAGEPRAAGASPTAVFFYEQSPEALITAVKQFEKLTFNSGELVKHASNWDVPTFKANLRKFVRSSEQRSRPQ